MGFLRALLGMSLLCLLTGKVVATGARVEVEAVQPPAWVERGEQRQPLLPGQSLKNRDRLVTGPEARVLLRLSEGSAVKLGENASLRLDALGVREGGVFTAALDVAHGALRFTTGAGRAAGKRAVNVRVATVTAGIRGTDLWGRADAERDQLCLVEGRITVIHPEAAPVLMSESLSAYAVPKGLAPQPVSSVEPAQWAAWAAETELRSDTATLRKLGRWAVHFRTEESEAEALALYDRVRAAGYPVRIQPLAADDGAYRYALQVPQLASRDSAEALAVRLRLEFGFEETRVLGRR